jgi:hypothetical protein
VHSETFYHSHGAEVGWRFTLAIDHRADVQALSAFAGDIEAVTAALPTARSAPTSQGGNAMLRAQA